jgi:hypothetical protein
MMKAMGTLYTIQVYVKMPHPETAKVSGCGFRMFKKEVCVPGTQTIAQKRLFS